MNTSTPAGEKPTQRRPERTSPRGLLYLLWAEGSTVFKVGFTQRDVLARASVLQTTSPLPLRIVGTMPGSRYDEGSLHLELRAYRSHGEWFSLPEDVVWPLLRRFGATS